MKIPIIVLGLLAVLVGASGCSSNQDFSSANAPSTTAPAPPAKQGPTLKPQVMPLSQVPASQMQQMRSNYDAQHKGS